MATFFGDADVPGWGRWTLDDGSTLDAPYDYAPAPMAPPAPVALEPPPPVAAAPVIPPSRARDPLAQLDEAQQLGEQGIADEARITAEAERLRASRQREAIAREQTMLDAENRRRQQADAYAAQAAQKIQEGQQALAGEKLDSGRWWANRSTGQKVAAGLALALHGFMNPTGPNGMADAISRSIERDLDEQRANLAKRSGDLQAQQSLLQVNMQRFGNELDAMAASRADYKDMIARQIESEVAGVKSPITLARAQQAAAAQRSEAAKLRSDIVDRQRSLGLQAAGLAEQRRQFDISTEQRERELGAAQDARQAEAQAKTAAENRKLGVDGVVALDKDPSPVLARTEDEGKKARELSGAADGFVQNLRRLKELGDWRVLPSDQKREARALLELMKPQMAVMLGQGAAGEQESSRYEKAIGDPNAFFGNRAQVEALEQGLTRTVTAKLSSYTGRKVQWRPSDVGAGVAFKQGGVPARGGTPGANARPGVLPGEDEDFNTPRIGASVFTVPR